MGLINPAGLFLGTPIPSLFYKGKTSIGDSELSVRTFSAVDIGGAGLTRRVFAWINPFEDDSGSSSVSATIGGIAATAHKTGNPGFFSAVVPTGATADIVATLSREADSVDLWTYVSYYLRSGTPTDSDSDSASKGDTASVTIDVSQGGIVLANCLDEAFASGVTVDYTVPGGFENYGSAQHLTAQARTIATQTSDGFLGCSVAAYSFR